MKALCYVGSRVKETHELTPVRSPYDGKVVSQMCVCTHQDALEMLDIAQKASKVARLTPLHQRIAWLNDVAEKLAQKKEEIAHILCEEVGKPIAFARVEVERAIETILLSSSAMTHVHGETFDTTTMPSGKKSTAFFKREPVGVALAITPFNFPLNLVAHKIAPALVAGNSVILKPTSQAPRTAFALATLFIESRYAIPDALSLIYSGEGVNETLIRSDIPRVISFTGSVGVAKQIMVHAGIKKLAFELGGNAATFIDASANMEYAA